MGRVRDLRSACLTLREQLLAGRLATESEIAACWPGGADNPRKGLEAWADCRGLLKGLCRRVEFRDHRHDRSASERRAMVLDAIAEVPETVELTERDKDGVPLTLTVYQKSDLALREVHKANLLLASYADDYQLLTTHGTRDDVEVIGRLLSEQSYLQRLVVWVTTTPGPGLPYPEGELCPVIPDTLASLSPMDFYALAQAFQRVNILPLTALDASTKPGQRPDWPVFWSGLANELKTTVPPLRRDRGLAGLVLSASELARSREESQAKAKAGAA